MFSLAGREAVDLSPKIKARVHRLDGTIEAGTTDPCGKPWGMQEGRFAGDNSFFTLYWAPASGDETWHQQRMSTHNGSLVQGGRGHISHWAGTPDAMQKVVRALAHELIVMKDGVIVEQAVRTGVYQSGNRLYKSADGSSL